MALWAADSLSAQEWNRLIGLSLKHYDKEHLFQIALPLGGIGTGTVSLGGRGELRDWEIMNVPGKKYSTVTTGNNAPFFSIYVKSQDNIPVTTLLEGPLYSHEYLHYEGRPVNHHGFPRFAELFRWGLPVRASESFGCRITGYCKDKGIQPIAPGEC